jgi:hypothetical protein
VPVVVAAGIHETPARELLRLLRKRGHGAVACLEDTLPATARVLAVRAFEFTADAFVALDAHGQRYPLAYADVLAIVRARWVRETQVATTSVERSFSLGRAVMTGGVAPRRSVERTEHAQKIERDEVAYLFRGAGPDPMLLRAGALQYDGLGAHKGKTARESFATLVDWLRRHASAAVYDERLLADRPRSAFRAAKGGAQAVVESSNADAALLAAFLLVHAHLQRQL